MKWMGFTIACWRKKTINASFTTRKLFIVDHPDWRHCIIALLSLILIAPAATANGVKYQTGALSITLSDEVENAVNNGVELTFICEFATFHKIPLLKWPKKLKNHNFTVKHHALSKSYLVSDEVASKPRIFSSTTDTMAFVASEAQKLFAIYHSADTPYQMRVRLSKYDLPAPMRLNAFVASDWHLNSGWEEWQSVQ